jgi:endonuclease/exonuclease/phosphatase family metal-dependent hydrolase
VLRAVALAVVLALHAWAADVPVAGAGLVLHGGRDRDARITLRDAAIVPPAAPPGAGGLVVSGGAAPGQCFADVPLETILTRWPAGVVELTKLYKNYRTVFWARLDHPLGPVDVFSTHLASSSDGAEAPCAGDCPPACVAAGARTVRDCQGVQMAALVAAKHNVPTPAVATGDFNQSPGSLVYGQFTRRGWLDTYLAAGNAECDVSSGEGCTSGRADEDLSQMESPETNENERIDFIFLVPPASGSSCTARLDPAATRLFADRPNPFATACGPAPQPICWSSDHEGTQLRSGLRAALTTRREGSRGGDRIRTGEWRFCRPLP